MPGRGRGRGRGRGGRSGRGRSRNRGTGNQRWDSNESPERAQKKTYNIDEDPQAIFTGTASTQDHLNAQNTNRDKYCATIAVLLKSGIQITQNARIRALAMAFARGDHDLVTGLLKIRPMFGLVEVLRAVNMLDAGRQVRVLEKKLKRFETSGIKVKPQKFGKLKSDIDNLKKLKPPIGSASGSVCKHIQRWVRTLTPEELELYAINLPKDPWMKLADIVHLHPEKDFPCVPWFLPYCFGTIAAPEGSLAFKNSLLSVDNVNESVQKYEIPYSIIKKFQNLLSTESKSKIATYEKKLDTVLWYYEEIACPEVDKVIYKRLEDGDPVTLPNGKLLERLLKIFCMKYPQVNNNDPKLSKDMMRKKDFFSKLVQLADPRLTSIKLSLESPILIMGDKSGSMTSAIQTSTIIAGLLTSLCAAKLVFFDHDNHEAPFLPKTAEEILKLAVTIKAGGGTSPIMSLLPLYKNKEVVKTIIMVTDEAEGGGNNIDGEYMRFANLYKKYHDEVYKADLLFVSFLYSQNAEGQMVRELKGLGFNPRQVRLNSTRPDLTKLDDMFGQLSVATKSFKEEITTTENSLKVDGVIKLFDSLKIVNVENES